MESGMQPQQPEFGQDSSPNNQMPISSTFATSSTDSSSVAHLSPSIDSTDTTSTLGGLDAPETVVEQPIQSEFVRPRRRFWSWRIAGLASLILAVVVGGTLLFLRKNHHQSIASDFNTVHLQLSQFSHAGTDNSSSSQTLRVNGNLQVTNSLAVTPSVQPATGTAGQLYFDKNLNQFAYYNGQAFVTLGGTNNTTTNVANNTVVNNSTTTVNGALNAVTSSGGTNGTIAVFTGAQTLGNSLLAQNNGAIEVNGNLDLVNNTPSSPISIWDSSALPADPNFNDAIGVEVGIKFQTDITGRVNGIRFYKGNLNTGTHIGNLWTATGHLLGSVTFTSETASGWQEALFAAPVVISPGTTYIVSYHTNVGFYSADVNYFSTKGFDTPPLHALQDGADGNNGVFVDSPTSAFPSQGSHNGTNYWVDVDFTPNSIPGVIQFAGAQITSTALANNSDLAKRSSGQVFTGSNTFRNTNNSTTAFVIQDAALNTLFLADTTSAKIIISQLTITGDVTLDRHLTTSSLSPPTIVVGAAACTGGTASVSGTDVAGLITVTSGTGCSGLGKLATVTFLAPYTTTPRIVLTPANANAAGLSVYIDKTTITISAFDLQASAGTISNTTEYDWYYQVIQ